MEVRGGVQVFGVPAVLGGGEWRKGAREMRKPGTAAVNRREKRGYEFCSLPRWEVRWGQIARWVRVAEVLVLVNRLIVVVWAVLQIFLGGEEYR